MNRLRSPHSTIRLLVLDGLVGVLLGKGGEDVGILFNHLDVVGEAVLFAQQVFDHLVLFAGLHHPVDGHVLLQGVHHQLGVASDGVELRRADVVFRKGGG